MYEMQCRIRYSEIDSSGKLSMSGLLRLFQDCGYEHAQARALGLSYAEKTHCTWYLLSWHIHAFEMPPVGAQVTVRTCIYEAQASVARKSLQLCDTDGNVLAVGDTMWVYMNVDTQQPAVQPLDLWPAEDYGDPLELPDKSRRIRMPKDGENLENCPAHKTLIDTNGHANNVRLTEFAMTLCDAQLCTYALRAEFKQQIPEGMALTPIRYRKENEVFLALQNAKGETMASFLFRQPA